MAAEDDVKVKVVAPTVSAMAMRGLIDDRQRAGDPLCSCGIRGKWAMQGGGRDVWGWVD
jgi:hypothetical protein